MIHSLSHSILWKYSPECWEWIKLKMKCISWMDKLGIDLGFERRLLQQHELQPSWACKTFANQKFVQIENPIKRSLFSCYKINTYFCFCSGIRYKGKGGNITKIIKAKQGPTRIIHPQLGSDRFTRYVCVNKC